MCVNIKKNEVLKGQENNMQTPRLSGLQIFHVKMLRESVR